MPMFQPSVSGDTPGLSMLPALSVHRGGWALWPEHTMMAFDRAYAAGARWFEADVRVTSDGAMVLQHDATLDRATTGTGNVSAATVAQFRALTVDHLSIYSPSADVAPAATFAELLDWVADKNVKVSVELKDDCSRQMLTELLRRNIQPGKIVPNAATLSWLEELNGAGYRGIFQSSALTSANITSAAAAGCVAVFTSISVWAANPALVVEAHTAGLYTVAYTIQRRWEYAAMRAIGIDVVACDDPVYLLWGDTGERMSRAGFETNSWLPGMFSSTTTDHDLQRRGEFPGGGVFRMANLGGASVTSLGQISTNTPAATYTIAGKFKFTAVDADDKTIAVFFAGLDDAPFVPGAVNGARGYLAAVRRNGQVILTRRDGGTGGVLLHFPGGVMLGLGVEYEFSIAVTPTTLAATFAGVTATFADATYRGGNIALLRDACAVDWRDIVLS